MKTKPRKSAPKKKPTADELDALRIRVIKHKIMMAEGFLRQYIADKNKTAVRAQRRFLDDLDFIKEIVESSDVGFLENEMMEQF